MPLALVTRTFRHSSLTLQCGTSATEGRTIRTLALALAALFATGLAAGYFLSGTRAPEPASAAPERPAAREGVAWVSVPAIASRSQLGKKHALALEARREFEHVLVPFRREYIDCQLNLRCSFTDPAASKREEKGSELTRKFETEWQRIEARLKLEAQAQSAELHKQLAAVAEEVAHREGFRCVVLRTDAQPPGAPGPDLTEQVLAALDARFP